MRDKLLVFTAMRKRRGRAEASREEYLKMVSEICTYVHRLRKKTASVTGAFSGGAKPRRSRACISEGLEQWESNLYPELQRLPALLKWRLARLDREVGRALFYIGKLENSREKDERSLYIRRLLQSFESMQCTAEGAKERVDGFAAGLAAFKGKTLDEVRWNMERLIVCLKQQEAEFCGRLDRLDEESCGQRKELNRAAARFLLVAAGEGALVWGIVKGAVLWGSQAWPMPGVYLGLLGIAAAIYISIQSIRLEAVYKAYRKVRRNMKSAAVSLEQLCAMHRQFTVLLRKAPAMKENSASLLETWSGTAGRLQEILNRTAQLPENVKRKEWPEAKERLREIAAACAAVSGRIDRLEPARQKGFRGTVRSSSQQARLKKETDKAGTLLYQESVRAI